jgi:hypothetical protein
MLLKLRIEAGDYFYKPTIEDNCGACGNRCAKKLIRLTTQQAQDTETSVHNFLSEHAEAASDSIADKQVDEAAVELFRSTNVDAELLLQASDVAKAMSNALMSFAISNVRDEADPQDIYLRH